MVACRDILAAPIKRRCRVGFWDVKVLANKPQQHDRLFHNPKRQSYYRQSHKPYAAAASSALQHCECVDSNKNKIFCSP
jgi:hypothetical protein